MKENLTVKGSIDLTKFGDTKRFGKQVNSEKPQLQLEKPVKKNGFNIIDNLVKKIDKTYRSTPGFITHCCLSFIGIDPIIIETYDIDYNLSEKSCAISNRDFSEKIHGITTIYTDVILSDYALKALNRWYDETGMFIDELSDKMSKRGKRKDKHIVKTVTKLPSFGDKFGDKLKSLKANIVNQEGK
jgi:hypothetical protein